MKKIILLSLVFGLVGCNKKENTNSIISNEVSTTASNVVATPTDKENTLNNWVYDESNDEMRGIKSKFASITSINDVHFSSPYEGGSKLLITLREKTGQPLDVLFVISKGQYACDTISRNCYASFKFDDNTVETVELDSTADHASDVLFVRNDDDANLFIKRLLNSTKLIIELPFYQNGSKQFKFDVSNLKWNPPTIKQTKFQADWGIEEISGSAEEAAAEAVAAATDITEPVK